LLVKASGVTEPTVLAINIEGRLLSPGVLVEFVVPLGQAARARTFGPLAIVLCTSDEGTRDILRAIAESHNLALFVAPSPDKLSEAEPLGPLTATEVETLDVVRRLGGRVTVANFAQATKLEATAATNRLVNVFKKGYVQRVERSRRDGVLFVDPRAATPSEDPADPTSGDFSLPEPMRRDVKALADMQGREPSAVLATAWQKFLSTQKDQLAADHRALQDAMKRGDKDELARLSKRFAKKQAQARAERLSR
jgi:predicted transcriptional regulator